MQRPNFMAPFLESVKIGPLKFHGARVTENKKYKVKKYIYIDIDYKRFEEKRFFSFEEL